MQGREWVMQHQPSKEGGSMSGTYRFHFTIGQWIWVVAIVAVCLAAIAFDVMGEYRYLIVLANGIFLAGAGVLLYNVRLSPWIWVVIAGFTGPSVLEILVPLANRGLAVACSLLYVLGLGMTFRDLRRRMEGDSGGHQQSASTEL